MVEAFSQMLWPLLACFVLVGIHAYLGIHVIARKVIFVDLALAQIAALGAVYGVFIGLSIDLHPWQVKTVSVSFTMLGALLCVFTRSRDDNIPHEAIIGIIYAAALSMTFLLTASLPHGAEDVRQMLAGNILWVSADEVLYTGLLYVAIGALHFFCRRQFFALSHGGGSLGWDFLFYASFGVVVTSSVSMGGVLLVFGYLVIPSMIGIIGAHSTKGRLMLAWGSGLLMSLIGVVISYHLDLPSGPTIVVMLALLLAVLAIVKEILSPSSRARGLLYLAITLILALLFFVVPRMVHIHPGTDSHEDVNVSIALKSSDDEEVLGALTTIKEERRVELFDAVLPLLSSPQDRIRSFTVEVVRNLDEARALPHLKERARDEKDPFILMEIANALLSMGESEGFDYLQSIMKTMANTFAADDAALHARAWLEDAPDVTRDLSRWLDQNRRGLKFDKDKKKFLPPTSAR